jgi:hypothetical protein
MRVLRLLETAAEAEALRLSQRARRTARSTLLGAIALVLLTGAIGFGHVAAWCWLRDHLTALQTALIFTGVDLLLAVILLLLAFRSGPGTLEREALALRRQALAEARESAAFSTLVVRLLKELLPRHD